MAGGAFLTSRELFVNPIWQNIVEFRLFFLIYGNAVFSEEGVRVDDTLTLQRGQWLRSTRKLQEDLHYIENRQVKTYSISTINRTIQRLVRLQRVCTKTHELGTVFTVLNYEQYQGFGYYQANELGTQLGTVTEQSRNNNKNVNKGDERKDIKPSSSQNKKKPYSEDDRYYKMAVYLHKKIMEHAAVNNKEHLVINADMQKWADEFRKIVEIDEHKDLYEMRDIIDWCTSDHFWQTNILSPKKLREKYSELGIKMTAKKNRVGSSNPTRFEKDKDDLQRMMREAEERERNRGDQTLLDYPN